MHGHPIGPRPRKVARLVDVKETCTDLRTAVKFTVLAMSSRQVGNGSGRVEGGGWTLHLPVAEDVWPAKECEPVLNHDDLKGL